MTGGLESAALTGDQKAVYDAVMAELEKNGGKHYVSVTPVKKDETADSNYLNDGAKGDGGIAIGQNATSQGRGIAMGYKSSATPKEGTKQILHNSFEGIAIGQEAHMEVPGGIAIGLRSKVEGTLNTKDGNVNEQGTVALGTDAYATGNGAAAFGWKAKGIGEGAMAFGKETEAKESGTAFGGRANAAAGAVAMGWQANAHDLWAMSIGTSSDAKGKFSTALGGATTAEAIGSTAVGFKAVSKGVLSTAVGAQSVAEESGSVALGADSVANTKAGKIGYIATGGSATFEDALKTLNKKEDYDKWTATVNASKTEYDNLTQAFNDASKDKKDEAKAALDAWKGQHEDFIKALTAKEKLEATWRATKAAVSVGADGVDKAGNRIIESRQITNVAAGTQDTDAVNVAQLKALNTKVDQGTIHYYSVTSDKKAAGSNFDNDGAKAADSMVIGIGSSSEAPNSTVLGNNNTLKRYNADQNGSSSRHNIVVGQNMDVEGAHNAVFGTDYQNNRENRKTMVAGKYNTVIGVGNLAGYTAEKDPQDRSKWIYSKVQNGSDSGNVVVGMNNTATRGSIVIGADSEASSHGTSVGSNNKVIGNGDKGLALGNSLTVDGEQAVAIGSDSQAKADYAVAIGQEALAEKESSIAFGNSAKAQNNNSVAFGSFATATARSGVALGSSSLANREKGAIGYLADAKTTSEAWKATRGAISIGNEEKGITRQLTGLAAGSEDTDAVNVAQLKAVNTKVEGNKIHYLSIGPDNEKNLAQDGNYNNDGADSHWGIAIGVNASSKGGGSIAIGKGSQAHGTEEHRAQGVSIGSASRAIGAFATAVGHDTKAFGEYSVAYGLGDAYGRGSIAIGSGAVAALKEGITKEEYNKLSDEEKAWYGKTDYDDQKVFYQFRHKGKDGKVEDIKNYGMAIGSGATSFDNAGLAVGLNAKTNKDFGVALGAYAENKVEQGVALGTSSVADRAKDVKGYLPTTGKAIENFEEAMKATGKEAAFKELKGKYLAAQEKLAKAQEAYNADQSPTNMMNLDKAQKELKGLTEEYAVMTAPWTSRRGAVSVGNDKTGFTRQITGVAAGSEDTDAVNVAQLKALDNKVTDKLKNAGGVHYFSVNSDDSANPDGTNWKNDGATGKDAIAIGKKAVSEGDGSIAIGRGSKVFNTNQDLGMAIGDGAEAAHGSIVIGKKARDYDTDPKKGAFGVYIGMEAKSLGGSSQTVIGNYGQAKGEDSTAIGTNAHALGIESLAVGSSAKSLAKGAASFGTDSIAEFDDSTALGSYANGRGNKSVASGNKSVAAGHNSVAIGYQTFAHNGFIDGDEYKALSPEEQKKYFEASGLDGYFLKDTADGNDAKKIGDTYLNTAVGSYSRAYKHATTLGGMTSAKEEGTAVGTYAKAYKKGAASLGYKAQSNAENGVALGAYSFADREKGKIGYALGGDNSTLEKALESAGQKEKYDELTGKINPLADEYNGLLKAYLDAPRDSAEGKTAKEKLDAWTAGHPDFLSAVKEKQQMTDAWQSGNGAVSVGKAGATRQITNVAAGSEDTDAVNVAQLKVVNEKADKNATDITNLTKTVNANGKATKVTVDGEEENTDGNLKITKKTVDGQTTYDLSLNDELTIGKDGKDGKIGINGKDGKSAEITVGKGEPGVDGKDGVTRIIYKDKEGKEYEVATLDDGLKFKGDNDTVVTRKLNQQLNITGGIKNAADLSDGNIGVVGTQDGGMEVKLSKKLKGLTSAEFKDGDNITNITAGDISITKKEGDKTKTLNIWELKETVETNAKATKVTVGGKEENTDGNLKITKKTKDGQTTYDLSLNDELTIGKDGKDGKIGINGKDGKSAEITVGKGEPGVDGKDGVTRIIYKDKEGKEYEVATLDDGLKFKGDNDTVVTRKLNQQLNITGGIKNAADLSDGNIGIVGTQDGGMAVKLSKKLKGLSSAEFKDGDNITNITAGNVTITRKEGNETKTVNLWELNNTVNNITNGTTDVSSWKLQANGTDKRTIKKGDIVNFKNGANTEVTVTGNDITVDLNAATKKQINDNTTKINNIDQRVTTIENNIDQKIEGSKIKVEGDKATGVKATEVTDGNKVTGYKVSLENKVKVGNVTIDGTGEGTDKKGEITGLTNTTVDAADFATKGRAATEEQLKAAMGKVQAQSRTTVKGKGNITVTPGTASAAEYTVELAKDITVDSVTAKTVKADEYKVGDKTYINKDGINANGNKITNVGDGEISKDSKDAVNGNQLFATNQMVVNNMNQINNLRDESREGDAMGAAMAALKPLDFDPYQRSQVMAGVGYYRGKEAFALGLAHYKNEDLMIHGGLAYAGNSELMANVGVSYRFGSSENREALKARNLRMPQYDKGPISSVYILQDEVERLTKENKEANDRIAALEAKLEQVLEKVK